MIELDDSAVDLGLDEEMELDEVDEVDEMGGVEEVNNVTELMQDAILSMILIHHDRIAVCCHGAALETPSSNTIKSTSSFQQLFRES